MHLHQQQPMIILSPLLDGLNGIFNLRVLKLVLN